MIPQSFIEDVQERTDIVELISSYIPLKRAGRNFRALCPFHSEKTSSFLISPQKQIFHCFGCGQGGGAIQFIMQYEKVVFPEAVEMLAKRLGLVLPQGQQVDQSKTKAYEALEVAMNFYHQNLVNNSESEVAREYFRQRGISDKVVKDFKLGLTDNKISLLAYMRKRGFTIELLEKTSLIVSTKMGYRDVFRERIIFPIFDTRDRPLGFGGRIWKKQDTGPKYINSLENVIYSKRKVLFGLHLSKEAIIKSKVAIVTEGYLDMIVPFAHGIPNIVASLGTALTQEQIELIKRYATEIVLVFDADKAGQMATLRAFDLLLESETKVTVARLPQGYDPDSFVREKGKDAFLELVQKGVDFLDFTFQLLKETADVKTIEGKTQVAKQIFALIFKIKSEISRYEYLKKLAGYLEIKEQIVIAEFKAYQLAQQRGKSSRFTEQKDVPESFLPITEKILFKFMVNNNEAFSFVKKYLSIEDFSCEVSRQLSRYLFRRFESLSDKTVMQLIGSVEDRDVSSFLTRIMIDESIPFDEQMFKSSVQKLRKLRIKNIKEQLIADMKKAEIEGDKEGLNFLVNKYNKIKSEG